LRAVLFASALDQYACGGCVVTTTHNILESRGYLAMRRLGDLLGVSIWWVVASLPVVTLVPATAALFAVARAWVRGNEPAVSRYFFTAFRDNLRYATQLQIVGMALAFGLVAGYRLAGALAPPLQAAAQSLVLIASLLALAVSLWALALMVNFRTDWQTLLRWSVLLTVGRPGVTVRALLLVGLLAAVASALPMILLLATGIVALAIYPGFQRGFDVIVVAPKVART
jgi:uncharacterized membrane protein YesL